MPLFEGQCSTKSLWSAIAVELGDGGPCSSKDERIIDMLEIPEAEDNKKIFVQISNKRRAKENIHPLLDVRGNVVTKDEEKAEVLNAFLASGFNNKTSCFKRTQPPEVEDIDWEQNEAPII